jgi:uncharacterized membrane protein YdbT with pleckstrin-like domain
MGQMFKGMADSDTLETEVYKEHPAMFRNRPFSFALSILLIAAFGLGLVILLIWWLKACGTRLTITNRRTILEKGLLSRSSTEVLHAHIRNIQTYQSLFQRMMGVGKIGISSAGQDGIEIEVNGIIDPIGVKRLIDRYRGLGFEDKTDD